MKCQTFLVSGSSDEYFLLFCFLLFLIKYVNCWLDKTSESGKFYWLQRDLSDCGPGPVPTVPSAAGGGTRQWTKRSTSATTMW